MRIKLVAIVLLIAVVMCGVCSCASISDNGTDSTVTSTENTTDVTETTEAETAREPSLLATVPSTASSPASGGMYLRIVGKTQGEIKGEYSLSGDKSGTIPLLDFSDDITVPTDADSGLPSGRAKFKTVTFVHKLDRTSPRLRQAIAMGEPLELIFDFYRIKGDGIDEKYFTVEYENALLVSVNTFTGGQNTHYEEVSFTFSEVTYTYVDGNVSYTYSGR